MINLILGDCVEKLKELPENSVDSIVTDPPAGISFMGKSWDTDKGGRDSWIAWMREVAKECKRVLKPGGHVFVWAIPRTSHWTAMAWENAGFEIREIVAHIFGSGFPKSLNVGKAVDKLQGNERKTIKEYKTHDIRNAGLMDKKGSMVISDTKGTSEWEGWGSALKPAREDWLLMRKPLAEKTIAKNCLKWGTGGINIDESRVEFSGDKDKKAHAETIKHYKEGNPQDNSWKNCSPIQNANEQVESGRFPANLLHDNSEEVRECFPEAKGGAYPAVRGKSDIGAFGGGGTHKDKPNQARIMGDSGNASRFFKSIIYQAKASRSERNKGCEELETFEKFTAGNYSQSPTCKDCNLTLNGTNDHSKCSGEVYYKKMESKNTKNNHPTVKSVALMEYLIKMITPKGGIVLDPFMGSGSTGVAAKQNGFDFIGIEKESEYIKIAEARINAVPPKLL